MTNFITDGSGKYLLHPDDQQQTLTYNADGTLASVSFVQGGFTFVQTLTYSSGQLTSVSAWVKQ